MDSEFILHNIENLGLFFENKKEKKTEPIKILSFYEMQKSVSDMHILDFKDLPDQKL